MLYVIYAESQKQDLYAECNNAVFPYAECHHAKFHSANGRESAINRVLDFSTYPV
jgi:hypothetical protein